MSLCLVLLCLTTTLFARDVNTARRSAQAFQNQTISAKHLAPAAVMQLVSQASQANDLPAYYIFNGADNFVVVAGDDRLPAIIGYSDQGTFDPNNVPPNMQWWLEQLKNPKELSDSIPQGNIQYVMAENLPDSVLPLLGALAWNQGSPYNDEVPTLDGKSSPIGCTATAFAQIIKYHEYPAVGTGVPLTYTSGTNNFTLTSSFDEPYDWDNMLDSYSGLGSDTERSAVSHLMIDVAILCHMDFDPDGSGAYASVGRYGLQVYLGYDDDIRGVARETLPYESWENLLMNELNSNRPFLISAFSMSGGHAFVCDGYNSDRLFHINWGWGGLSNGYFLMSGLNPSSQGIGGSTGGYFYGIEATIGIKPKDSLEALDYNMLSVKKVLFPKDTFQTSELQDIALTKLKNTMGARYVGDVALLAYKTSDSSFVASLGKTGELSLDAGNAAAETSIEGDFSHLADGEYYCSVALLPTAVADTIFLAPRYPDQKIPFTVSDSLVTIKVDKFAVQGKGMQILAPSDTAIYASSPVKLTFNIEAGSRLYNGTYYLRLLGEDYSKTFERAVIMVRANDSLSTTTTFDCPDVTPGDYTLKLYLDTLYRLNKQGFDSKFVAVDSLPLTVLEAPDTTLVELTEEIYGENVREGWGMYPDSIYMKDAFIHVPLENTGGYGATSVICIIWDGSTLVSYSIQTIILQQNERQELLFDFSHEINVAKKYNFEVRKIDDDFTTYSFSNSRYYKVTYYVSNENATTSLAQDETTVSTLNYFNHMLYNTEHKALTIYTLDGRLVYQGQDAEVDLEDWFPTLYVVKASDEVLKVLR